MEWTQQLSVGVREIDEQHQELIRRLNGLYDAMRREDPNEVIQVLSYVADYVVFHFAAEEREMAASEYPGLETHRLVHQEFVEHFLRHAKHLQQQGATPFLNIEISAWLKDWVKAHICGMDRHFGEYLLKRTAAARTARIP